MDRRRALKNIGFTIGGLAATPTALSVLSSCTDSRSQWQPTYFTLEEAITITHVVDVVFPVSELPGAVEVNVPQLIDVMFRDVEDADKQKVFKEGISRFVKKFEEKSGKSIEQASNEDIAVLFEYYMVVLGKDQNRVKQLRYANPENLSKEDRDQFYIYNFLLGTRDYTIFGYYSSEKIGKEVLYYDPIPGGFDPCIPLSELDYKTSAL
ncbi:MAG: gluconate 2-dehydrogenase subunit 3 family protein [Flavobacteriaceae bacterium]